ncbi:hypothetical protein [Streptomyces sp. NPDC047928]|uniref:hypothetical protein n=1 Tax=unclassified Streptomyces TaxID=2593676 RepID=UPI00371E8BDD
MNLRMIGLGALAVFTALLPLAASAGPAGSPVPGTADAKPGLAALSPEEPGPKPEAGTESAPEPGDGIAHAPALLAESDAPAEHDAHLARCGPELVSPDGIEAQTCVLTEGSDTWARTYYRNATGAELSAVLTLMGPESRTVRTHCRVAAGDEPGACETPRERTRGKSGDYTAMAEFAAAGDPDAPLLLRVGSNSPETTPR